MSARDDRTGVFDLRKEPELEDLFEYVLQKSKLTIRTATVGVVTPTDSQPLGYDPITQKVSVTVQSLRVVVNTEVATGSGSTIPQPPIVLKDIPVNWGSTNSGSTTYPLNIGDSGELIVQDRGLQRWLLTGAPTDPTVNWTHNLSDAVFHPGLRPNNNPIVNTGVDGPGTSQVATVIDGNTFVRVGAGAVDFAIKGTSLATALTPLLTTLVALPPLATANPPIAPPIDPRVTAAIDLNSATLIAIMQLIQSNLTTKAQVE